MTAAGFSGARAAFLIFAAALLAYLPALRGGFVWNDRDYVTAPALQPVGGLGRIWGEVGATEQYYPVLHSAFWVEHRLWGGAPLGYHLTNVLLHATAACLVALVLARLGIPGGWIAALLFALHPVAVESVAWISEEKNTLSTVFYLAAAWAYLRFDEERKNGWYLAALGAFALALLSKSVTATLPAALLVVFWWRRGRLSWRREVLPLVPWFGLGAADGLFTAWVEHTYVGAKGGAFALTFAQRSLVAGHAVWFYLAKLLWPADLIFIYPRWDVVGGSPWIWLYPLALLVLVAALWLLRRRTRAPLAALLFFVGSLFPVLGFFNVFAFVFSFVADHFQYLASIGVITLAAAGWAGWESRAAAARAAPLRLGCLRALPFLVAAVLGVLTWRQSRMYADVFAFYRAILDRNPNAWLAHHNLGVAYAEAGHGREAIPEYEATLRLKPDDSLAEYDFGTVLFDQGRIVEAMAHYRSALRLEPGYIKAHFALGQALARIGRPAEAVSEYRAALRGDPGLTAAHEALGVLLLESGQFPAAADQFRAVVLAEPGREQAEYNLGVALAQDNRLAEAQLHFAEAVRLEPGDRDAQVNLAMALAQTGHPADAIAHCEAALRLDPTFAPAQALLAELRRADGSPAR